MSKAALRASVLVLLGLTVSIGCRTDVTASVAIPTWISDSDGAAIAEHYRLVEGLEKLMARL